MFRDKLNKINDKFVLLKAYNLEENSHIVIPKLTL